MGATSFHRWFDPTAFAELSLEELLEDPLVRLLMSSGGAEPSELKAVLATMAKRARSSDSGKR
jgi:hypothetical protein